MATTKAVSANPIQNNGSTVLGAGATPTNDKTNLLTLQTSANSVNNSQTVFDLGHTNKALSAGVFANKNRPGKFVVIGLTNQALAGQAVSGYGIMTAANDGIKNTVHRFVKYQRIHLTGFNSLTGAATYGGNRGDSITLAADHAANPTDSIPGEFVYMVTGTTPTQADYPDRETT